MKDTGASAWCRTPMEDPNIDNSGSHGALNLGPGTLNLSEKEATVDWIRPMDVSSDRTMTLVPERGYKALITFTYADSPSDTESRIRGTTSTAKSLDWVLAAPPEAPPLPEIAESDDKYAIITGE